MAELAPQRYLNPYTRNSKNPQLEDDLYVKRWDTIKVNQSQWVNRVWPLRPDLHRLGKMMDPAMTKEGPKVFSTERLNKLNILIRSTDAQQLAFLGAGRFSEDGPKSQAQGLEPSQRGAAYDTSSIGLLNTEKRIYENINKEPDTKNHMIDPEQLYKSATTWAHAYNAQGPNPDKLPGSTELLLKSANIAKSMNQYYETDYDNRQGLTLHDRPY